MSSFGDAVGSGGVLPNGAGGERQAEWNQIDRGDVVVCVRY